MIEYGLFSDEGLVEDGLYSMEEAAARLTAYDPEDALYIAEICPEHPEHKRDFCEECKEEKSRTH